MENKKFSAKYSSNDKTIGFSGEQFLQVISTSFFDNKLINNEEEEEIIKRNHCSEKLLDKCYTTKNIREIKDDEEEEEIGNYDDMLEPDKIKNIF